MTAPETPGVISPDAARAYSYSPPSAPIVDTPTPHLDDTAERIARGIQLGVCAVLVAVWSVVGFLFWIPFLVRSIGVYTTAVLSATFTGAPLFSAQRGLDTAVRFWFGGFQAVIDSRHSVHSPDRRERLEDGPPIMNLFAHLFRHLIFTLLFWVSAVALWLAIWRGWL